MVDDKKDDVLTTRDVAKLLGVSISTAQSWIEAGTIRSWKTPGGHRRVYRSSVMRLLNHGVVATQSDQFKKIDSAAQVNISVSARSAEFIEVASPAYPVAADNAERLRALERACLIDTPPEPAFDRLTRLAAHSTNSPIALISLLTASRQWFKSRVGVELTETPREKGFCTHAVLVKDFFIIEDTLLDTRFMNSPFVKGESAIRFYAGFPLHGEAGYPIGTLCILDHEPRKLRTQEFRSLCDLRAIASEEIQRRTIKLQSLEQ